MQIGTSSISNHVANPGDTNQLKQTDTSSFSDALRDAQKTQPAEAIPETRAKHPVSMDTNHGKISLDIGDYLTAPPQPGPVDLKSIPLLLPTEHNINTLSKHSEEAFRAFLSENGIPTPPSSIKFDAEGKLVLPADYPFADELSRALDENPGVEKALQTSAALASHYADIMEGAAFRDEMATARNAADQERIVQKYSHLFDDNRPGVQIVLSFLNDGSLLVGEKGGDSIAQTRPSQNR